MDKMMIADKTSLPSTETGDALRAVAEKLLVTVSGNLDTMRGEMVSMADTIRAMAHKMDEMERTLSRMVTLTPEQVKALKASVAARAKFLLTDYGLPDNCRIKVAHAITKAALLDAGVRRVEELPRMMYAYYSELVQTWDDYRTMTDIGKAARK